MRTIIILGSSRSNGNTAKLCQYYRSLLSAEVVDLADYQLEHYNYQQQYSDNFHKLIKYLLSFERIIFASPMYWYSASSVMKVFLDRLSDLLDDHKSLGRQLRNKHTALLATGADKTPPDCFEAMFELTFKYLGMHYHGMHYLSCAQGFKSAIIESQSSLFTNSSA